MIEPTLWRRALSVAARTAVVDGDGAHSYADLLAAATSVASRLTGGAPDLAGIRVAVMVPPSLGFVATQWGTWMAGGVSVPLCLTHPAPELAYVLDDAEVSVIVASSEFLPILEPVASERGVHILNVGEVVSRRTTPRLRPIDVSSRALILYTSGSTGKPKGVVWSHSNLEAQLQSLSAAWEWSSDDRALLTLPLHHVHGLVNVVTCALWNGASVEVLPTFDAEVVWDRLASRDINVFMAVPTIYRRLISAWEGAAPQSRQMWSDSLRPLRLMVSGSAALPVPTLDRWREISGHTLLERYGMTEIGMALSNPYRGERIPGSVGTPLPSVEVRLVDDEGNPVAPGTPGEIEVRGPSVFGEYWRRPDATRAAFRDGWFRTGDDAVVESGVYRILGRRSVDIIKTGGEKVSALEIEDVLRGHTAVRDCAVVGLADPEWGERVAVAVMASGEHSVDLDELRAFARERLAPYKLPRDLIIVDDLPRNALGKVVKPRVRELFRS